MAAAENVDTGESQETEIPSRDQCFNNFFEAGHFVEILESFQTLCSEIGLDSTQYEGFYPALKKELTFWKASALWQLLDARASMPEYEGQKACEGRRVLVIGAGPVGLRSAIEAALLGAKVDVVEKRTSFSRNNSLHLWPFLITDLRNLGAKKFYGKFASGTIDHICIRILQCILLKVCLLLGIKIHGGVTFTGLVEPKNANGGWMATVNPSSCPVSSYYFDVIMAADGKQNSLPGFRLKEFRAKLALAITVNFVNNNTKQECSVPEISGVAYVYRQDFFKSLASAHGIELENIVYYKDETHYFVMTATKNSLLKKGVLKKDNSDPEQLLARANIDQKSLERYAVEAATYSTEGALGDMKFEKNHRGENDVALFDFTSLFAAENAARILERKGKRILLCVAGDTLIEPFWPTGSGLARGFLGVFDNVWMMKRFVAGVDPIDLLEEREAILYLLPQTTPERLVKNFASYTIDPKTRYLYLNELVPPGDVTHLFSSDNLNAMNAAKNRNQAPPPPTTTTTSVSKTSSQEPRHRTVPSVEDAKPKRSKSTEELASKAESAESPHERSADESHKLKASTIQSASETSQTVKEFWQKRQPSKSTTKTESKSSASQGSTASKPPLPSSAKLHQTKPIQSSNATVTKSSPKASPQPAKDQTTASPKLWKKGHFSPAKSASPEPVKKNSKKDDSSKTKHSPKSSPKSSPKWSRFSNKGRSKSVSPERETKKSQGTAAGHPLEVATSLRSLDRETEGVTETEQQQNVLDIIKKYNKKDEDVKGPQKQGKAEVTQPPSKSTKSSAKKGTSKESKAEKGKQKDKQSKDESKKEASTHKKRNLFSFFKKKSYDVTEEETTQSSKQHKKKKGSKQVEDKPETEHSEQPLTVQGRIKQLMEHGVATDGIEDADASEVVLVSVSPHEENEDQSVGEADVLIQEEPVESLHSDDGAENEIVKSKLEELPHEPEEEEAETVDDTVERVKKLQSFFQQTATNSSPPFSRSFSVNNAKKRSKEIDLSEVLSRESKEKPSHPLWLARVIQALNKCLERLRKENDVMVAKTALEIMNTIFNNVQSFPNDDTYRRVRISSEQFHDKIWRFNNARQFLARSGWVEIDDFIVLPIDSKLDTPKRVLDKHLDIVNQMLWSMHLELPHSPGVVKRAPKFRDRSFSLMRRESYATRIVEESLLRVEEDKMAMAAAKIRKSRGSFQARATSPTTLETLEEGNDESIEDVDHDMFVHMSTQEGRMEEVQTMKAASAARDIWKQKESISEREYRFNLETELYDLPRKKISQYQESSVSPPTESISVDIPFSEEQETAVESDKYQTGASSKTSGDQLKKLIQGSGVSPISVEASSEQQQDTQDTTKESSDKNHSLVEQPQDDTKRTTASPSPTSQRKVTSTPTKKLSDSSGSDQLRQLVMISPVPPKHGTNGAERRSLSPEDQPYDGPSTTHVQSNEPVKTADALCSTTTSIISGRQEYERLTMEAAAQTRQKWKDVEANTNQGNGMKKSESGSCTATEDRPITKDDEDASNVITVL